MSTYKYCLKIRTPYCSDWKMGAEMLDISYGDRIRWRTGTAPSQYTPCKGWDYIHFEEVKMTGDLVLCCSDTHEGGVLFEGFSQISEALNNHFGISEEKAEEDHTGMIQGFDGKWRWL